MKYEITYACGHEATVELFGPSMMRERKIAQYKTSLCPECFEEQKKEQGRLAGSRAAEKGWVELKGSEKQVALGNVVRELLIEAMKKLTEASDEELSYLTKNVTLASWWITNMKKQPIFFKKFAEEAVEAEERFPSVEQFLDPDEKVTSVLANIQIEDKRVIVASGKDNTIIKIVKEHGFRWDSEQFVWYLPLDVTTGSGEERAAEITNKLLLAGVPVRVPTLEVKNRALDGEFEPMCTRWITRYDDKRVVLTWDKQKNLFESARKIPGSRWEMGVGLLVPVTSFEDILGFAESYGFSVTEKAMELLSAASNHASKIQRVRPERVAKLAKPNVADILNSSRDILEELKDED